MVYLSWFKGKMEEFKFLKKFQLHPTTPARTKTHSIFYRGRLGLDPDMLRKC